MKRRTLLAGFATTSAASSMLIGSGAFTSVSADRRLIVETAGDNNALLRLKQLGDGSRSSENGTPENVEFSFPGKDNRLANPNLGLGVDSVYEFDRDSGESDDPDPDKGLLRIENQGTQPVEVYSEHDTDSELEIELYDVSDDGKTALRYDPPTLNVGGSVDVGFRVRTFDAGVDTFDETLTIIADQPDN